MINIQLIGDRTALIEQLYNDFRYNQDSFTWKNCFIARDQK